MQQRTVRLSILLLCTITSQLVLVESFVNRRCSAFACKAQSWTSSSSSERRPLIVSLCSKASALQSHIETIKVRNFGGIINGNRENGQEDVTIRVGKEPNLVAVTGETGSGKSLLVAKVIEYITGCKASPSIIPTNGEPFAAVKVGE
jgi:hypothetical protein